MDTTLFDCNSSKYILDGEEIYFGNLAQDKLIDLLKSPERTAIFAGNKSFTQSNFEELYLKHCSKENFFLYRGIPAEPDCDCVNNMVEFLIANKIEQVIAIGGGSVLDAAKAAFLVYQTNWKLDDLFGSNKWSSANPNKTLKKIIAIPTTSGTGSEATPYSNIVDRKLKVKKLISEVEIVPSLALMNYQYTLSMAQSVTLATGCDALAHLIEGFINVGADNNHPQANNWALTGIKLVKENLKAACLNGQDEIARSNMAKAALLGGMVIRYKSTGLPHLCSFSWFGRIEHGIAAIMLLPECWKWYLGNEKVAARTMELAGIFNGNTPVEIIDDIRNFLTSIGVPKNFAPFNDINDELLEKTALAAKENPMKLELAPRRVPLEDSYQIIKDILNKTR